jgi:hypothetical protein
VVGTVFVLVGLIFLYLLRHLLVQVIVVLIGVIGLVIAFALIVVGLGLIFGGFWIRGRMRRYLVVSSPPTGDRASIALNTGTAAW